MVNVVITGIPAPVKLNKFITFLKKVIFRCYKEMHINYYSLANEEFRQLSVSTTYKKALKAKKALNGFIYKFLKKRYQLECWLENLDEDEIQVQPSSSEPSYTYFKLEQPEEPACNDQDINYEPPCKSHRYSRSPVQLRSSSPCNSNELTNIDHQIELIKKQRILLEEENKLILEKKKLEYLQNLGINDFGKLLNFEEVYKRNDPQEISKFLEAAQSRHEITKSKLPSFMGPCKDITNQMKPLIGNHSEITSKNRSLFYNLLNSTLKKRLALILEGKQLMLTKEIVNLYRTRHPRSSDMKLVNDLCNTIKISCWPQKRPKISEFALDNLIEGQTTEAQNSSADGKDVDTSTAVEGEDPSQLVGLDEFVDLENDVADWVDDGAEGAVEEDKGQSFETEEPKSAEDEITEPKVAEETNEVADQSEVIKDTAEEAQPARNFEKDDEAVVLTEGVDNSDQNVEAKSVEEEQTTE